MTRTMTLDEFADWCGRVAVRLPRELAQAHREATADVFRTARAFSSGTVSTPQLRRLDHPFARRHGSPLLAPQQVNRQTGRFWESWVTQGPLQVGGTLAAQVHNTAPYAGYLDTGTGRMFARPLAEAVAENVQPRYERRTAEAIVRAITEA